MKNLDEIAKRLGYADQENLEMNIESYGKPLLEWWEVIKELKINFIDSSLLLPTSKEMLFER